MVRISPLAMAVVAAGLLVVVVAVDVAFNRGYTLEAQHPDGTWVTVAESRPGEYHSFPRENAFQVNATDTITMRLRADNGWPLGLSESYEVRVNGRVLANGTGLITAPARATGEASFQVDAATLLGASGMAKSPGDQGLRNTFVSFELTVGGERFGGALHLQEVAS